MDIKTLEYMGARVDKAREIQKKIDDVNSRINRLESDNLRRVTFAFNNANDFYTTNINIVNEIKAAALNAYCNRRDQLQAELDEL